MLVDDLVYRVADPFHRSVPLPSSSCTLVKSSFMNNDGVGYAKRRTTRLKMDRRDARSFRRARACLLEAELDRTADPSGMSRSLRSTTKKAIADANCAVAKGAGEASDLADDTIFGLSESVFGRQIRHALSVAPRSTRLRFTSAARRRGRSAGVQTEAPRAAATAVFDGRGVIDQLITLDPRCSSRRSRKSSSQSADTSRAVSICIANSLLTDTALRFEFDLDPGGCLAVLQPLLVVGSNRNGSLHLVPNNSRT